MNFSSLNFRFQPKKHKSETSSSLVHSCNISVLCFCVLLTEVAAPWTEDTVRQCLFLYLSLLPLNHRLVHELASVYTEAIADIKRSVLRAIEQPVSPRFEKAQFFILLKGALCSFGERNFNEKRKIFTDRFLCLNK